MNITISSVQGNSQKLDGGAMFGNAPRAMWSKWITPDEIGRIPLSCRCLLVQIEDQNIKKNILIEAGIGCFFEDKLAERFGVQNSNEALLLTNLEKLGLSENDIDMVFLTHLHFDHAGGVLKKGKKEIYFPKAEYVVGKKAWERANDPHMRDRASFIPELNQLLSESNRLKIVSKKEDLGWASSYIDFIESDGHTPGQLLPIVLGSTKKIIYCGDLIPGSHWVNLPITMGYDRYPELLIEEKKQTLDRALSENWMLFYTHDSKWAASNLSLNEKKRYQSDNLLAELIEHKI